MHKFQKEEISNKEVEEFYKDKSNEELYDLLKSLDPKSAESIHKNNRRRVLRAIAIYNATGTKKSDLALLVHMVNSENLYADLASVKLMNMSTSGGILSESLITPNHANTYLGREYGVLLSQDNLNIASMDSENRMSGYKKSLTGFVDLIFNPQGSEQRNYFRNAFLKSLEINPDSVSDEDFAKFYKRYLVNTETLSDINLQGMYVLGKNIISGVEVKKAIIAIKKCVEKLSI